MRSALDYERLVQDCCWELGTILFLKLQQPQRSFF